MTFWPQQLSPRRQFLLSLCVVAAASLGLYVFGVLYGYDLGVGYLVFNLFLAVIPLLLSLRLTAVLRRKRWSDWEPLGWTLAWLLFLPNSFYMVSDFIHLRGVSASAILYAAVLFTDFIFLALLLGFCSLAIVHTELRRRLQPTAAAAWVASILISCSFAIYIGRDLRWNSWDVIINPGGLLFDISDRLLKPEAYPVMFITVGSFFVFLGGIYALVWSLGRLLQASKRIS